MKTLWTLLAILLVALCVLFCKEYARLRDKEDLDLKYKWAMIGYHSGVKDGRASGFAEGYLSRSSEPSNISGKELPALIKEREKQSREFKDLFFCTKCHTLQKIGHKCLDRKVEK